MHACIRWDVSFLLFDFSKVFLFFCWTSPLVSSVNLGAVGLGCRVRLAIEHRELAAGAGANNLLPAGSGIIDLRRRLNVVDCALARLIVAGKTPRVGLAICGNGEAVVGAGGDGDNV
jgi:hypothetical protein